MSASSKTMNAASPPSSSSGRTTPTGGAGHDLAADRGGPGEGHGTDRFVVEQGLGDLAGRSVHEVDDAGGDARVDERAHHLGRRQRSLLGDAGDDRASRGESGGQLAGLDGAGEVPRGQRGHDADRAPDGQVPSVGRLVGHDLALRSAGLLGEPAEVLRAEGQLSDRLGATLAGLAGQRVTDGVGPFGDQPARLEEDVGPPPRRQVGPVGERSGGRVGRALGRLRVAPREPADDAAVDGVGHVDGAVAVLPGAVDEVAGDGGHEGAP